MKKSLKILFTSILVLMIGVTLWSSLDKNVFEGFKVLFQDRWGIATLADAYCGFLTFYAWVFYKESDWTAKLGWFVLIMIFGNIAMAAYVLLQIRKMGPLERPEDLLLRKPF